MTEYDKYVKYKWKYLQLKQDGNITSNNQKFECQPTKKFSEICVESPNGIYKTKDGCINDCEGKYINFNLVKARLKSETRKFELFIRNILDKHMKVYIKGGNVLGLNILKMLYNKYKDDDFEKHFNNFLKMDLIKDWDFAAYSDKKLDMTYRSELDGVAKQFNLVPRAKTFILYQTKFPMKLDDKVLFEIALLDNEDLSGLELPLTTMKMKVTPYNIKYIFMFAKLFYSYKVKKEPFDMDVIKRMINAIDFIIYPHVNGLFLANKDKFDTGGLSEPLLDLIKKVSNNDINTVQFLITHFIEPNRMFLRLIDKNIPKTQKILDFLKEEKILEKPKWLLDINKINNLISTFVNTLSNKLVEVYKQNKNLDDVMAFLDKVNLKRIEIEFDNCCDDGMNMVKKIFSPLVNEYGINKLSELQDTNQLTHILKFLDKKKMFVCSNC